MGLLLSSKLKRVGDEKLICPFMSGIILQPISDGNSTMKPVLHTVQCIEEDCSCWCEGNLMGHCGARNKDKRL